MESDSPEIDMDDYDENRELREEVTRLKKELHDYEVQVASLSNKGYQVPDGEIKDEYQRICRAIETWIAYAWRDERGDFRYIFQTAINSEDSSKTRRLSALGLEPTTSPATSCQRLNWLKAQGGLNYFILSLVISRNIFHAIIETRYPVGFVSKQSQLLRAVEQQLIDSGKDISAVNQWISNTISAFCKSDIFRKQQKQKLEYIWEDLTRDLKYWLKGHDTLSKHESRLRRDIFEPAIRLHLKMRSSFRQYKVTRGGDSTPNDLMSSVDIGVERDMKDIATWRTETRPEGDIMKFQCLYPGIVRLGVEADDEDLVLVQPVHVFYKIPVPRQSNQSGPLPPGYTAQSEWPTSSKQVRTGKSSSAQHRGRGFLTRLITAASPGVRKQEDLRGKRPSVSRASSSSSRNPSQDPNGTRRSDSGSDVEVTYLDKNYNAIAEGDAVPQLPIAHSRSQGQGLHSVAYHDITGGPSVQEPQVQDHYRQHFSTYQGNPNTNYEQGGGKEQ